MKCKDCHACRKGYFESKPQAYVCIGVKEPFVINDINVECTEYPILPLKQEVYMKQYPYVDDTGIYAPCEEYAREGTASNYKLVISKEMFIEAYIKWIKGAENVQPN